ncbi:MAG: hypothetical protein ACYTEZ_09740 [Planctomycetota bacterium]
MSRYGRSLSALAVLAACRAVSTSFEYPGDLRHPSYVKRSMAVRRFAELEDRTQLPDAFRLLLDEEAHIRAVAYETIRALSPDGEDFGYRPWLPEDVRIGIVMRWEAWWRKSQAGEAAGG